MIIVKTSNGDVLINEMEIERIRHDKENHFVYIIRKGTQGMGIRAIHDDQIIEKVESVTYINEATDNEHRDDGSEVAFLRRQLADEKNLCGFINTMAKQIESHLRHLASDIIQVVNYGDEIPTETRKRLRDIAEESKVYSLDNSKWYERRQYMETHLKQAEDESSHTAMLNEKVEQQAVRIRELEAQLDHAKGRLRFCESENKSLQERNNALENLNFWQRIFNF